MTLYLLDLKKKNGWKNLAIDSKKLAIEERIANFKDKSKAHILKLYNKFGNTEFFCRDDIAKPCDISYAAAGNLIAKIKEKFLLEEVAGFGKGKYKFK